MNILITGSSGYLGRMLYRLLVSEGYYVWGVDNDFYGLGHREFDYSHSDISTVDWSAALSGIDTVVHLAALVGAGVCDKYPLETVSTNVEATKKLAEAAPEGCRIIYCNTTSGFGNSDARTECTEETPMAPISLYGRTKCEGERLVLAHNPTNVSFRLATVHGVSPRMRFDLMVNDFTEKVFRKSKNPDLPKMVIYEPHFMRNFVHIRDVCRAILFALTTPSFNGVFNLGNPNDNISKWVLLARICSYFGLDLNEVAEVGAGEDKDKRNYIVSTEKIQRAGFFCKYGLMDGVHEVAELCEVTTPKMVSYMRNA